MNNWPILMLCNALGFNQESKIRPEVFLACTQTMFDYFEDKIDAIPASQHSYSRQAQECARMFLAHQPRGLWQNYPQKDSSSIITTLTYIFNWHAIEQEAHRQRVRGGKRKSRPQDLQEDAEYVQKSTESIYPISDPDPLTEEDILWSLRDYHPAPHDSTLSDLTIQWLSDDAFIWPVVVDHRIQYHIHHFELYLLPDEYADADDRFRRLLPLINCLTKGTEIGESGELKEFAAFRDRVLERIYYHTSGSEEGGLIKKNEYGMFSKTSVFNKCWEKFEVEVADKSQGKTSQSMACAELAKSPTSITVPKPASTYLSMMNIPPTSTSTHWSGHGEEAFSNRDDKFRSCSLSIPKSIASASQEKLSFYQKFSTKGTTPATSGKQNQLISCDECLRLERRCSYHWQVGNLICSKSKDQSKKSDSLDGMTLLTEISRCKSPELDVKTEREETLPKTTTPQSRKDDNSYLTKKILVTQDIYEGPNLSPSINETSSSCDTTISTFGHDNPHIAIDNTRLTDIAPLLPVVRSPPNFAIFNIFIQKRPNMAIVFENPLPSKSLSGHKTALDFFGTFERHARLGNLEVSVLTIVVLPRNTSVVVRRDWDIKRWNEARYQIEDILNDGKTRSELHVYIGDISETENDDDEV